MKERVQQKMIEAEDKAWNALSRYKFWMFGYHAAQWVNLNKLLDRPLANPFYKAVKLAEEITRPKGGSDAAEPLESNRL